MTGVDVSARARVVGIDTQFVDLRNGNAAFLPMQVGIFAQGQSGVTYPSTKFQATSAGQVGKLMGYKSPAYLALREMQTTDGRPGIGTIPVWIYPLQEAVGAAAAAGDVTPSGTTTVAGSYRLRCGGVKSPAFVVPKGALTGDNLNTALRNMGAAANAVLEFPMTVSWAYGTVTSTHSTVIGGSNGTLGTFTTTGNPKPGNWTLTCTAAVLNGGTFKLVDPDDVVVSTTIAVGSAQAGGGLGFTLSDGTTDFGVGDVFTITVPATKTNLTAAWKGAMGNQLVIEVLPESDNGTVFAITQPTGGLVNPDVSGALAQMGNSWITLGLNTLNLDDTTTLDLLMNFGEGRWGVTLHKPLVFFVGNTIADQALATAVSNSRPADRINSQLVAPGSPQLPFIVAAREMVPIAVTANNSPPTNYTAKQALGVIAGTDGQQWDNSGRDYATKHGSSTIEVVDNVVQLSDVMTFYNPTGEVPPAYLYVVDIIKEMNVIYNLALIFARADWAGAPIVADDQPTDLPEAKHPKQAVAEVAALFDSLGRSAILADAATAKKTIKCVPNSQNPKRIDLSETHAISGNGQIISITNNWGFFYG